MELKKMTIEISTITTIDFVVKQTMVRILHAIRILSTSLLFMKILQCSLSAWHRCVSAREWAILLYSDRVMLLNWSSVFDVYTDCVSAGGRHVFSAYDS